MSYWTFTLLLFSIAYLAYRHPASIMDYLSAWLRPKTSLQPSHEDGTRQSEVPVKTGQIQSDVQILVHEDDESVRDSTPRATAVESGRAVPSLSLSEDGQHQETTISASSAADSSPRSVSKSMPPPTQTSPKASKPTSGLMLPPSRPNLAPPPSSASGLRVPSSGPIPNRGPPVNSQQRVSGGLSASGVIQTPNPRGKVLLSPGHSPMDWAALTRSSNLSGVPSFQRVTPTTLKSMTGRKGKPAWSSWQGKVYNITPYLDFHPGGKNELMKAAGRDGTKLFMEVHPWVNWENMLGACLVGVLVSEDYGMNEGGKGLDDID